MSGYDPYDEASTAVGYGDNDTGYLESTYFESADNGAAGYFDSVPRPGGGHGDEVGYIEAREPEMGFKGGDADYLAFDPDSAYAAVQPDAVQDQAPVFDGHFGPMEEDWLSEQWDLLKNQPWFRGHMKRADAVDELQGRPAGSFLVRVSSEPGHYAISVIQDNGRIEHMLILSSYAGEGTNAPGDTRYRLGTYSTYYFNTVPKLIAYYIANPYIEHHKLRGVVQPEQQDGGYLTVQFKK
eukprot:m.70020 g.70020  ORF g.70020 m.70020 type:complete len:239 (-) comp14283_c1_seq1:1388-2104(-)